MTGQPTTTGAAVPPASPQGNEPAETAEAPELVLVDRFLMVPEWVLDADIGDCALRLYAVLLRYGNTTGARMPARTTLAARLHKKSTDTVDRALAQLVQLGAVQVQARCVGRQRLTNQYRIRTSRRDARTDAASRAPETALEGGGRNDAAQPRISADTPPSPPPLSAARGAPDEHVERSPPGTGKLGVRSC